MLSGIGKHERIGEFKSIGEFEKGELKEGLRVYNDGDERFGTFDKYGGLDKDSEGTKRMQALGKEVWLKEFEDKLNKAKNEANLASNKAYF